jgi:hypothetical protein
MPWRLVQRPCEDSCPGARLTDVAWLTNRRPRPPEDLSARVRAEAFGAGGPADAETSLMIAGRSALERALAQPGRVRAAAFDLLAADALVTYACEAALECDDPDAELARLVSIGGVT